MKSKFLNYMLVVPIMLFLSMSSLAAPLNCGVVSLDRIYTHATRSDGSVMDNRMSIMLGVEKVCSGVDVVYLDNSHPAYNSILSIALASYMSGKKLRIVVNDATVNAGLAEIEWVNLQ